MRADLLCTAQSFGMEANSSDGPSSGPRGPNLPRGTPQAREPPGEPRLEEQQQQQQQQQRPNPPSHKPLFYFQHSQPFLPVQGLHWPLPVALPLGYNPYFGCPPLGYGMPMIPHYQPNPYMEPPTFVMPQTHHHLTDYRRILNPYYYRSVAYHARRYRYQHNVPAKEVTSSEVQTEPLAGANLDSGNPEVLQVFSAPQPARDDNESTLDVESPPDESFVIQTEELTVECREAPAGLELIESCQSAEVSHRFPADAEPERVRTACPDMLVVGTPGERVLDLEEQQDEKLSSQIVLEEMTSEKDLQLGVQSQVEDTLLDSLTPTDDEEVPTDEAPAGDADPSAEDEICYTLSESPELKSKEEAPPSPCLGRSQREDESQHGRDAREHQDTSFESLPAYLPSSGWRADFERVHICSRHLYPLCHKDSYISNRVPPTPRKQNQSVSRAASEAPSRRRKLEAEYREHPSVRKPKEQYKPRSKMDQRSLSDHECFLSRNLNENVFALKSPRLCAACLAKSGPALKRKAVPFQQRNHTLASTCDDCKSHAGKASLPDTWRPDTDGESSDNGSWRAAGRERLPGSKRNRTCDEARRPRERLPRCPHGNTIRELDENLPVSPQDKWRNAEQLYWTRRWQADKSRKTATANPDSTRSPHLKKHKMSQQSQGIYRQDARC
ncbi:uncharacterized protein LOC144009586 isoform X2 [Festucalex cinctus]